MKKNINTTQPDNTGKKHPVLSAIWKGIKFLGEKILDYITDPIWSPIGIFCFESNRRSYQKMTDEERARILALIESMDDGVPKKDPENKQS